MAVRIVVRGECCYFWWNSPHRSVVFAKYFYTKCVAASRPPRCARVKNKKGDISCEIFLVLPICHENEQIISFFFLSWWVTQVYNKIVIAPYLDFIHSYLFCFYYLMQCNNWLISCILYDERWRNIENGYNTNRGGVY